MGIYRQTVSGPPKTVVSHHLIAVYNKTYLTVVAWCYPPILSIYMTEGVEDPLILSIYMTEGVVDPFALACVISHLRAKRGGNKS